MPGAPAATTTKQPPYPTRFGWGMRLFLAFLLFDIVYRSFSIMVPWNEWATELDMTARPSRLATVAERARWRAERKEGEPDPVLEDAFVVADSWWQFLRPWPEASSRKKIHSWADGGKWGVAWVTTRLEIMENVLGVNEEWPMFSPNVGRQRYVCRSRLIYADGSERIVRNAGDPEDLTRYSHWFKEKVLDHELKIREGKGRADDSFGYCNLLHHRYATNDAGSPLAKIRLFMVLYKLPPPDVDAREWLAKQTGPPKDQVYGDFYEYDAAAKPPKGECLLDTYP